MNDQFSSTTDPVSPVQPEAERNFQAGKEHAAQAAEELRAAAAAKASELRDAAGAKAAEFKDAASVRAQEFRHQAEQRWEDARHQAEDWRTDGERYIRENPAKAVLYALGAGFILGMIFKK